MEVPQVCSRIRFAILPISGILLALVLSGCSDAAPPDVTQTTAVATLAGATDQPTSNVRSPPIALPTTQLPPTAMSTADVTSIPSSATASSRDQATSATTGLLLLSALPVKSRGEKTGYSREQYGEAWADEVSVEDGWNGCSTREDILRRDLSSVVMMSASDDCTVLSGTLDDQYTATTIPYLHSASSPIDIDHIVALADAWQTGANSFTPALRQSLANDPLNLQAVSSQANRQKSDGDTATWLPSNKAYRCEYVRRQIDVKVKYGLWVKPAEADAMQRVLTGCGGLSAELTSDSSGSSTSIAVTAAVLPATETAANEGEDYFPNCTAAKAAGRAPLIRGEAGYRAEMDGDDDGVACELAH